ncbi:hypothetical protein FXF51_07975 [Nonomuraea sp. PA05]|nr:hypothetical protein FXF51_07975 [Nonomuraea sp. PA05]
MTSLMQTYAYVHESAMRDGGLVLETSGGATPAGEAANPTFFDGAAARRAALSVPFGFAPVCLTSCRRTPETSTPATQYPGDQRHGGPEHRCRTANSTFHRGSLFIGRSRTSCARRSPAERRTPSGR